MSNESFRQALVAFSKNGSNAGAFKTALETYLKQYNKSYNQQVKNILSGTNYTNINTRARLLNRLALHKKTVNNRTQSVIGPPSANITRIKALLNSFKTNFNAEGRIVNENLKQKIQTERMSMSISNKEKMNNILRNYPNKNFAKQILNTYRPIRFNIKPLSPIPPGLALPPPPRLVAPPAPVPQNWAKFNNHPPLVPVPQNWAKFNNHPPLVPVPQNQTEEVRRILNGARQKYSKTMNLFFANWNRNIKKTYNRRIINAVLDTMNFNSGGKNQIIRRMARLNSK